MGKYILKRIVQFIPVFLGVTIILFALQNVVPGDPVQLITGGKAVSEETDTAIRAAQGLIETDEEGNAIYDENGDTIPTPLWKQYVNYLNGLLHGDLGTSYSRAISELLTSCSRSIPTRCAWRRSPSASRRWSASGRASSRPSSATRSGTCS